MEALGVERDKSFIEQVTRRSCVPPSLVMLRSVPSVYALEQVLDDEMRQPTASSRRSGSLEGLHLVGPTELAEPSPEDAGRSDYSGSKQCET